MLVAGCAAKQATDPVDEATAEPAAATTSAQTPEDLMAAIAPMRKNAQLYYTSEQRFSEPAGDQPWHRADLADENRAAGLPVYFAEYVFPGGSEAAVRWMSDGSYQGTDWADATVNRLTRGTEIAIDLQTWELVYSTDGSAADASANWIVRSRTNPAMFVQCALEVDPDTQEVLFPPCDTFGFY